MKTPLVDIIKKNESDLYDKVKKLLGAGNSPHETDKNGVTALQVASACSRFDVVKPPWLINQGYDLDEVDSYGDTILYQAISANAVNCLKLLIQAGMDVFDAQAIISSELPLIYTAQTPEIFEILFKAGADPSKVDHEVRDKFLGLGKKNPQMSPWKNIRKINIAYSDNKILNVVKNYFGMKCCVPVLMLIQRR